MFKTLFISLISFCLGSLSAQTFSGKLSSIPNGSYKPFQVKGTLKVLAVMADFQEDRDEATFGNGKFGSIYTKDYGLSIIDPLPHNKQYFEAHLLFAKNYFAKESKGKQNISYYVLPDIITVSKTMRNYSPPSDSSNFSALADFSKEVWTKASQTYPDFNFKDYDIFLIFHAGVGRDVTLPGSVGDEKDLPSVYLSPSALKKIFGPGFNGFSVSNGSFDITNSMIIPETESRELASLTGSTLLEISINGLLVSSIASYLGLPDLFDTQTGKSAIGRFGLMDGQAIFAYNGLFPPAPSAWEKIYLGWAEPVTIQPGRFNINIAADLAASNDDTTILKVPINSSEYYLLENRERDVNKDGAIIKYILGGDTLTKVFPKDTSGFYSFETDSVDGVVIDVDEYDWAEPGNGVLIWHIDDNIINQKIGEDQINTDKQHRGVSVVEADGIQDIGEEFQTIFGDVAIGEGEPQDLWYSTNKARFYTNRFGKDTRPSSTTTSGANSLVTISNFSDYANKMSFKVSYGDSTVKPILFSKLNIPSNIKGLTSSSSENTLSFDLISDSALYNIKQDTAELITGNFSSFKTISFNHNGNEYSVGLTRNSLNVYSHSNGRILNFPLPNGELASTYPVLNFSSAYGILIGTSRGNLIIDYLSFSDNNLIVQQDSILLFNYQPVKQITYNSAFQYISTENKIFVESGILLENVSGILSMASTEDKSGNYDVIVLHDKNKIKVGNGNDFSLSSVDSLSNFSLADLKNDGENYIIFVNKNNLEAVNLNGVEADNFPFKDPLGIGFTGIPLTADFAGDAKSEIVAYTKDGRIFAIDGGTGKVIDGFPISTGTGLAAAPVLFNYNGKTSLAAVDKKNNFYVWNISPAEGKLFWPEAYGSSYNNSFVEAPENNSHINEFFPKDRAYNYPNPVYGNETNIHYYVSEDSRINIKIFDLAGDFVAELNNNDAKGGFDNETPWKVDNIQSGIYIAKVEAVGSSGKTETNIIKIAVIK
jgi:hypothetical protein